MDIKTVARSSMHQVIKDFKCLIEADTELYALAKQMFEQTPSVPPFEKDPNERPQVRDFSSLLTRWDKIVTSAPELVEASKGVMGLPFTSVIASPLGTRSGSAFFKNDKVNQQVGKILKQWARYLSSEASTCVLNESPSGWFSPEGLRFLTQPMAGCKRLEFGEEFNCSPTKPHHGFKSWDDFFTRSFRNGIRPIAAPHNQNVIANACESCPWRLDSRVQEKDRFWIKEQPYSLRHVMNNHPLLSRFIGGTMYQGFLSAAAYHRWHSPIDGFIFQICHIPGTYFTKTQAEDFDSDNPEDSQGFITATSTRLLIFIEADNQDIGLMCVMPVGWVEVSTCEVTVQEGQRVNKGDQLGMFHFGGSSHCLLFGPQVSLQWDFRGQAPGPDSKLIPVNSEIARVRKRSKL